MGGGRLLLYLSWVDRQLHELPDFASGVRIRFQRVGLSGVIGNPAGYDDLLPVVLELAVVRCGRVTA